MDTVPKLKDLDEIIAELHRLANREIVTFKEKKFGVIAENSLGILHSELNELIKRIPKSNSLALELFDTGIYEARLLCSKIFKPKDLNEGLMEKFVQQFHSWEMCDSFCMKVFSRNPLSIPIAFDWTYREREFEKRAGFVIMAAYCLSDKKAGNEIYESFFSPIQRESHDNRLYVRKAVNWALRSIGKRNIELNRSAIALAQILLKDTNKTARWIASDALKELQSEKVKILDYPRNIYRK